MCFRVLAPHFAHSTTRKVERLQALEEEMAQANAEYAQAVNRASKSSAFWL